jgi:hypothetical protein
MGPKDESAGGDVLNSQGSRLTNYHFKCHQEINQQDNAEISKTSALTSYIVNATKDESTGDTGLNSKQSGLTSCIVNVTKR